MTRAAFRKILTQALSLLLVTLVVLFVMNVVTNQRLEAQKQSVLQKTLGEVLPADRYSPISLFAYLEKFPDILSAYTAYDGKGKILGYVIDVKDESETGEILTRISFSPDGETLIALQVLGDAQGAENEGIRSVDFAGQFKGIRVPAALLSDLPEQNTASKEYPAIAGLKDGTFKAQQDQEDEAGYKDFVEILVQGGRIVQVTWDAVQTDGGTNRAKASVDGEYVLSGSKTIWAAQAYAIQNKLIEVQDPAKIAIKSDGTTEVVPTVTVTVNAFVTLANKCIEDSKNGLAAVSVTPTSPTPTGATPAGGNPAATPSLSPTPAADPESTSADPANETTGNDSGNEDGVVQNNNGGVLSNTIDGLPSTDIKTKINEVEGFVQSSRIVVSTVNQAYVFLQKYLGGGS